ncbi:ribosome silencing factor [Candidatus Halobeggiatoa sp. HSG11]|nr:ribosome silencing factor [Candidatus Halobeggiatoa sp. HSG11]
MNIEQLLSIVKDALADKKAHDIEVLDVRNQSSITDFMVIATGNTSRQVVALAQHIVEKAKSYGQKPLGEEGSNVGEWVLVDLGDIIVHIMQPETRDFYQLEKLWSEANTVSNLT